MMIPLVVHVNVFGSQVSPLPQHEEQPHNV
jgi:hypothetical protein